MIDPHRPDPQALLNSLGSEAMTAPRGRLKIFLGMCPGVGKTYAMLEAAQREVRAGRIVRVGYVETHGRRETEALVAGLEVVPRRVLEHRGLPVGEMDLEAVLAQRPHLAVVDELAHTNSPGSRHPKRWQDVQELLEHGIDVFTTLNVQHVESRADTVRQITGVPVREIVPDGMLDGAVLELVDLPPGELHQRLREGKVYRPDQATRAAENFFSAANLSALREMALRLLADHVGDGTRAFRRQRTVDGPWKTSSRLLVAVGPGPMSESLIRWTRRMADELQCPWLAVHVEGVGVLREAAQTQLTRNFGIARELGAEVIRTTDEDLVAGLLRVANEQNVTQIVLGKPGGAGWLEWWRGGRLLRRLAQASGNIDLHVVRAGPAVAGEPVNLWRSSHRSHGEQYVWALGTVLATGLANWVLLPLTGPRVPGLVFLLAVVLLALRLGRGPVLLAGALSALVWNFFFLPPRFTFSIASAEDGVLFGTYFIVALVLGQLVARIRAQSEANRRREERSTALFELNRDLAEAGSRDEVVWHLLEKVGRAARVSVAVCLPVEGVLSAHPDGTLTLTEKELGVSEWAYRQRRPAGRGTDNLPGAEAWHLPLTNGPKCFGVLVLDGRSSPLISTQTELIEAFVRQAALVLERLELRQAAEQTRWLAESERLSRTLLGSISHELRTPLAASLAAASALEACEAAPVEQRRSLLGEIQLANARLNRVVGNLLDVARLDAGRVQPRIDWHDAGDLVQTTLRELRVELSGHPLQLTLPSAPLLVRIDFSLLQHALANLLLNAAAHTAPGTQIDLTVASAGADVVISVADHGPGIPADVLPRIFDKFYRAPAAAAGGTGLGLTIARGFVEAQGGTLTAGQREGGGAVFAMRLPRGNPPATEGPAA